MWSKRGFMVVYLMGMTIYCRIHAVHVLLYLVVFDPSYLSPENISPAYQDYLELTASGVNLVMTPV